MKPIQAITLSLGSLDKIIVSKYQFSLIVTNIYKTKSYKSEEVKNLKNNFPKITDVNRYLDKLLADGILKPYKNLSGMYSLIGKSDAEVLDIVCTVDPFCYISHLSAMAYHGLTDRIPTKLFITSPSIKEWNFFAKRQMENDLGEDFLKYIEKGLPKLVQPRMQKINKTEIHCFNSKHLGAFKNVRERSLRVATIGRTFLEMLKNPELCGGINHVIDVFEEHAKVYKQPIENDIDRNGSAIDKVRAGYILNELLEIDDEIIEKWNSFAQRGGSRKLDPTAEYAPVWSEKWQISLNVDRSDDE